MSQRETRLHRIAGFFSLCAELCEHDCVNKKIILNEIIEQLTAGLELFNKASRSSRAEATHEQNKAESKYDTRGLEASYLARGQSRQLAEAEQSIAQFQTLNLLTFAPGDPIQLSALVQLERGRTSTYYFIGPRAGGTEIEHEGKEVLVITPQSPLGRELMGKKEGDRLKLEIGGARSEYRVASVI
jgi:transcription elongation GreA/GreB family factor